jgi:aminodeoxyfutalosine synthase
MESPRRKFHIVVRSPENEPSLFADLLRRIKQHRPDLHIKAFTAVELDYMFRKAKVSIDEGVQLLKEAGLDSRPGGGAEIFDEIFASRFVQIRWMQRLAKNT